MFDHLINRLSFPWTIRCIGLVALFAAIVSIPALLSGSGWLKQPRKRRALIDPSALRDPLFIMFTACSFMSFLGYSVPYFYIPTYARERLGSDESTALYMLILAIAGSFVGRLTMGVLAHYLGPIVTWGLCSVCSGITAMSWMAIENEKGFRAFSVFWGMSTSLFLFLSVFCFESCY
jgi:predicted MFS family arabinose efflux permease